MNGKDLRIVFMGTPDFAVSSLHALNINGYNIVGVITAPDKPAGRGKKMNESAVKKYAFEHNLTILQPEKLKNPDFIDVLKALNADLQIVVAFRMLPEKVWAMPKFGTFNLHGSLLPQYRGAAPLNWAIINGEIKTGVTTFLLDQKIDTGKILLKQEIKIGENDTVGDIHDRLMEIGATLVLETVDLMASQKFTPVSQDELIEEIEIKHAPKIFKEDCKINWTATSEKVRNLIRGLSPFPGAWTNLTPREHPNEIQAKIFFAVHSTEKSKPIPGEIISDGKNYLKVACSDGWLEITDIQMAGKKRMKVADFLRGFQQINQYKFQ